MLDLAYHGYQTTTTNWDFLSYESMNSGLPKKTFVFKTEKPGPKTQQSGPKTQRDSFLDLVLLEVAPSDSSLRDDFQGAFRHAHPPVCPVLERQGQKRPKSPRCFWKVGWLLKFYCFGMGLTVCKLDLPWHWCSSQLWCYIGVEAVTASLWLTGQITQGQFDVVVSVQLAQCCQPSNRFRHCHKESKHNK